MDFFDKIGEKVSKTYNVASEKTANFAKETKLKIEISENKDKINEEYKNIGKKLYEKYIDKRDEDVAMNFIEEFKKIDALNEAIKSYENEILDLKDKTKCEKCGEEFEENYEFCPKCGAKNAKGSPEVIEAEIVDNPKDKQ